MSASPQHAGAGVAVAWDQLNRELAQLNPLQPTRLASSIVRLLAEHFSTNRVSIVFFNGEEGGTGEIVSTEPPANFTSDPQESGYVNSVRSTGKPLYVNYEVNAKGKPKAYKTCGFAVFPLCFDSSCFAVLCISNLSSQQMLLLESDNSHIGQTISQVEQLALLAAGSMTSSAANSELSIDELNLLSLVAEKLDTEIEARSVFNRFLDLVQPLLPLDMLSVIYAQEDAVPRGVVCLQRAAHRDSVESAFSDLAQQWQRRKRHMVALALTDARVFGEELLHNSGPRSQELDLGRCEVLPLFIDNDLFAIASFAANAALTSDRRRMRLLSFLLHQLMLHVKKNQLLEANSNLQTLDALTGLYNERHFYQVLEREFDRAKRYNVPLTLQIFDVDHFKDVNEAYGFETGDQLLREVSRILMENVRNTDFVCRYGGERFLLLLPETHSKNAEILANRLRRYIENFSFFIPNTNVFIKVTVSAGVASFMEHKPASVAQFIEFADTALYFAKRNGRNLVVGYGYVLGLMLGETGHNG